MLDYGVINDRSPHIIADLCELICLFEDIEVSRGDVESYIAKKGGEGLLSALDADSSAEINEKIQRLTEDAFKHLSYRQAAFDAWYPFHVNHDVLELKSDLTGRHDIYFALLADSRLKMFSPSERTRLAAEFEVICCEAIRGLLPGWRIYHFGVGGSDRAVFGTKLKDALTALAKLTRDDLVQSQIDELSDQNTGDGGLDLIALYEWRDPARAVPLFIGQCAAQQENWPEKKFEAHAITHERYFSFFHKPGSLLFIPVCYRGPDGRWIGSDAHSSLLVDRLRLTELFEAQITGGTRVLADFTDLIEAPFKRGAYKADDAA